MAGLKFSIHPLFIAFGIYFAFTGKVFSFIIYTLSAVLHEIGHYVESEKLGYGLKKIVLMPYGALIKGDISDIRYKDECLISLAGPFYNICIAVFFVALWWIFPDTYPYTDLIVFANFSLAIVNLLPCYPLDGGRFLIATLSLIISRKIAIRVVKILGVLLSCILLALFIYSIFTKVNFTLLFFSAFMIVGAVGTQKDSEYVKIYSNLTYKKTTRPTVVKKIIISGESEVKCLYKLLNGEYYYQVVIDGKFSKTVLEGENLYRLISTAPPYEKLENAIKKESFN